MTEMNDSMNRGEDLLSRLIRKSTGDREFSGRYRYVADPENWDTPDSLVELLEIDKNQLSPLELEILDLCESRDSVAHDDWVDFKWKITAFIEIEDIFESPILKGEDAPFNLFQLWYFYYESRDIIIEAILAGLRGCYIASNALLRLFLEFNILQLYYRTVCVNTGSFDRLEKYFREGRHPGWSTCIGSAVPRDAFCKPIRAAIDFHYKQLSRSTTHAYHPRLSPRQHTTKPGDHSLEGMHFWELLRVVLQTVLWGYYVNFPMLFHPRDKLRKFGFNGPVGLFIDKKCAVAVEKSLGDDFSTFLTYSKRQSHVDELDAWFNEHPDLKDEEIMATWYDEEVVSKIESIEQGYITQIAKMRVLRRMMSLGKSALKTEPELRVDDEFLFSFEKWKHAYKKL